MSEEIHWRLDAADAATFSGVAFSALLAASADDAALKLYYVRFEPRGRTHWHVHSGEQTLLIRAGVCRYQEEGGPVSEAGAGAVLVFRAGVRHWHGAGPVTPMDHVAINRDNPRTVWSGAVGEEEYDGVTR